MSVPCFAVLVSFAFSCAGEPGVSASRDEVQYPSKYLTPAEVLATGDEFDRKRIRLRGWNTGGDLYEGPENDPRIRDCITLAMRTQRMADAVYALRDNYVEVVGVLYLRYEDHPVVAVSGCGEPLLVVDEDVAPRIVR